ncbi:MAG: holo-ACP synthase [Anaerolineae bacterium]|nr:holo-ACP synthase [Anaerolineae bacterium]
MQFVLRTGIDLVEIERLARLRPEIRERFIHRVFTERELADAHHSDASLCGRFAAKEAAAKALGCGIGLIGWQDIEVVRGQTGEPFLNLKGKALDIAQAKQLELWSVSISHTKGYAVAVVIGIGGIGDILRSGENTA